MSELATLDNDRVVDGAVEVDGGGIFIVAFFVIVLPVFCGLRMVRARSAAFLSKTPRFLFSGKIYQ